MTQHKLSTANKVGFTLGDYASNLYWQSMSIFLMFFYTDAVGLSAATAGLIYMMASIVDALTDPVMGGIADRTRTKRGRYRPYILFGCVPLALSFVLLYWRPPIEGLWLALWMMLSHIIFRFAYTAVTIPYTSLNARLTDSSDERSTIAGYRMVFGVLAASTISLLTLPLVTRFGGVPLDSPDRAAVASGFTWAAVAFAVVATAIYPLVYYIVREPTEPETAEPKLGIRDYWAAIAPNRAFWVLIVSTCVAFIGAVAVGDAMIYYFRYYLNDAAAVGDAYAAMSIVGLAAIPAWVWITKFIGKRNVWFAATLWGLVCLAFFALVDIRSPGPMTAWLVVQSIGALGLSFTFWSMLPDTIEYGEWRTGVRTESFIFGLFQFFLKVALGVGTGLFGVLFDWVGYRANVAQSPETLVGLKWIIVGLPAVGVTLGGLAMIFYPLRKGTHESIVEQLAARRNAEPETINPLPAS